MTAVHNAIAFAKESLGPDRTATIRLEEIESSNVGNREVWLITLSSALVQSGVFAPFRATAAVLGADMERE